MGKRGWEDRRKQERRQTTKEKDGEDMVDEKNKRHMKETVFPELNYLRVDDFDTTYGINQRPHLQMSHFGCYGFCFRTPLTPFHYP